MENASKRRIRVLEMIKESERPLSASFIASIVGVSRQVIVGDVAILRAEGHQIIATARGYLAELVVSQHKYVRKVACQHTPEQTKDELYLLVDQGASVEDVVIDHEVYGELTGSLGLASRLDVDLFIERLEKDRVKLLSELTGGIHLHTVAFRSKAHFEQVMVAMEEAGFLVNEK